MESHVIDSAGVYRGPRITIIPPKGLLLGLVIKSDDPVNLYLERFKDGHRPFLNFTADPDIVQRVGEHVESRDRDYTRMLFPTHYHGFNH